HSVLENANTFFSRSKKLKKDIVRLTGLLEEISREIESIHALHKEIASAPDKASLHEISSRSARPGKTPHASGAKSVPAGNRFYHTLQTPGGREVLIAKSSTSSEELTFRVARPFDLFFHARSSAGAHVILRLRGRSDVPDDTDLMFAAKQAALHSREKHGGRVSVTVTEVSNVKRISGPYTGKVLLRSGRTITVNLGE
ncbi:MAG: NFACT RNA binding domain-containing protein, partial [Candidatus Wallbacteria bacterium]|nr:NFACT RNA binding domain-containing protein [Candidatus Wallbacteria bacterium]